MFMYNVMRFYVSCYASYLHFLLIYALLNRTYVYKNEDQGGQIEITRVEEIRSKTREIAPHN